MTPDAGRWVGEAPGDVTIFQHGTCSLVVLTGAFDVFDALNFRGSLEVIFAFGADVVIDAGGVTALDATFLGVLVALDGACAARGGRCRIVDPPAAMRTLCRLVDLDRLLAA